MILYSRSIFLPLSLRLRRQLFLRVVNFSQSKRNRFIDPMTLQWVQVRTSNPNGSRGRIRNDLYRSGSGWLFHFAIFCLKLSIENSLLLSGQDCRGSWSAVHYGSLCLTSPDRPTLFWIGSVVCQMWRVRAYKKKLIPFGFAVVLLHI